MKEYEFERNEILYKTEVLFSVWFQICHKNFKIIYVID